MYLSRLAAGAGAAKSEPAMRTALADFRTSLDRIRALSDNLARDTGKALADSEIRTLHETLQCGAVVLLSGYLEAFLKDVVRAFARELPRAGIPFSCLPDLVQERHYEGGGRLLSPPELKRAQLRFGVITRVDVVSRLCSAGAGLPAYELIWEAFADTKANPDPDSVKDIGKNLGISEFWPTISRNSGDRARWSETALTLTLRDLVDKRNEAAHTGTVRVMPTAGDLIVYVEMLSAFGVGLVSTFEAELKRLSSMSP